ncbi:MAG TPA: LuxR C-terminal-related transcriptional regulator [Trebonia sp.]|nr:LuxR C-terminal-related transcriptional regulator [Trebonia sp.]
MRTAFPDGAFLVQLSGLRDPDLLVSTVAAALGLPEQTAPARAEALLPHLRDKRLLLILDTCEHLIDACATFADALLRGADGPRLLATSRQTLDIPGEVVYPILPFAVPDTGGDAVALFADRARAALPGFAVTDENRARVIALCRGLDGIPLAIELAAVRLRAVGIEDMLARLGDRMRLLGGGGRQVDARHQTLRATISWSHDLCSPGERLLWARLSVFAGEFSLEAMEQVCSGNGLDPVELVDTLVRLVDKSIVIRIDGAEGGARYRMLDTIREFGAELLADPDEYRRQHRDYYLAVAREFDSAFIGPGQVGWVRRITDELGNLRLALEWCLAAAGAPGAGAGAGRAARPALAAGPGREAPGGHLALVPSQHRPQPGSPSPANTRPAPATATSGPPGSGPPTSSPPGSNPGSSNPPTSNPPTSSPPTSNPPGSGPPGSSPPGSNPGSSSHAASSPGSAGRGGIGAPGGAGPGGSGPGGAGPGGIGHGGAVPTGNAQAIGGPGGSSPGGSGPGSPGQGGIGHGGSAHGGIAQAVGNAEGIGGPGAGHGGAAPSGSAQAVGGQGGRWGGGGPGEGGAPGVHASGADARDAGDGHAGAWGSETGAAGGRDGRPQSAGHYPGRAYLDSAHPGSAQLDGAHPAPPPAPAGAPDADAAARLAEAATGLELATALWGFWASASRVGEGRYWLGRMLQHAPGPTATRVKGLWLASWFKDAQGERDGNGNLLAEARAIAVSLGDEVSLAWVDGFTAHARAYRGDLSGVIAAYADVLARMTRLGDLDGMCISSLNKAIFHELSDEHAECVAESDRLLARLPEGECWLRGWGLWVKSIALWRTRDRAEFAECQRAGLRLRLRFGDMLGLAPCLEGLAWLAAADGDFTRTARLLGAADRMWRAVASVPRFGMTRLDAERESAAVRAQEVLGERQYQREYATGAGLSNDDAARYALDSLEGGDSGGRGRGEPARGDGAGAGTAASPWEQLTARERQVAALVAQGLTNREIAARLVVSKRTVDAHVEHILAKLGFSSRVQVAALASVPLQPGRPAELAPLLRDQPPPRPGSGPGDALGPGQPPGGSKRPK